MFRLQTKLVTKDGRRVMTGRSLQADMQAAIKQLGPATANLYLYRLAHNIIEHNTDNIRRGLTPSGTPQRKNSAFWQAHKRSLGRPTTPLVYSGVLSNPRQWAAQRRGGSNVVSILPPVSRQSIVPRLRQQGYECVELPNNADLFWIMDDTWRKMPQSDLKKIFNFWGNG